VDDFFNFTKKFYDDAAKLNNTGEPPIHVFRLQSGTVVHVTETLLLDRWKHIEGNYHIS
jgi:hypothetical protein